jgi:uncharacterized protein (DUF488 family)
MVDKSAAVGGPSSAVEVFAIGHSTRPLDKFIELLQAHHIKTLADIRTIPRSGTNPQFNRENLERELPSVAIRYLQLKELGGLRRPLPDSHNLGWENASFRGYADYMQKPEFAAALEELVGIATEARTAIMCAEGNPFRCHRHLVADALTVRGVSVFHISSRKTARPHELTRFARVEGTRVSYPARLEVA